MNLKLYVEEFIKKPYGIGYHWYKWLDNPSDWLHPGANCGLVNSDDVPYDMLVTMATSINYLAEDIHVKGY